jgi:protein-tyrosine phosphatase
MFDLHNHCLPGLDDGARDWGESLAMARMAVADGIEGVVCTPHWARGSFQNTRLRILETLEVFKKKLEEQRIPLKVYPGAEPRLDFDFVQGIASGEVLTINDTGRFVLVELQTEMVPPNLEKFFWDLQVQGITPVLSHPERNLVLLSDPARLFDWTVAGVISQVTAASLLGGFGTAVQKFTVLLMEHHMAHVIATDSHGLGVRAPKLSDARQEAARIVGAERAYLMVHETPKRIIEGKSVNLSDPIPLKKRASLSFFWKNFSSFLRPPSSRRV